MAEVTPEHWNSAASAPVMVTPLIVSVSSPELVTAKVRVSEAPTAAWPKPAVPLLATTTFSGVITCIREVT